MLTEEQLKAVIADNLRLLNDPDKAVELLYKVAEAQEKETLKELTDPICSRITTQMEQTKREARQEVVDWVKECKDTPLGIDTYGYYVWKTNLESKSMKWGLTTDKEVNHDA